MRLDPDACWQRIGRSGHGVLGTVHAERGVDAVPVVFVISDERVVIPIDTVKPKATVTSTPTSGARLQRLVNLSADDRCVLLVDHYDDDWSQLWWVRAHGRAVESAPTTETLAALADAFPAYRARGAVTSTILVAIDAVTGWSAGTDPG
jgi:PPOX class probable F420-dependent enzyme